MKVTHISAARFRKPPPPPTTDFYIDSFRLLTQIVLLLVAFVASAAHGAHHDLRQYARIAARPSITRSAHYVSPAEAEPRFARATAADEDDYANGYKTFLDQYFADSTARRPDYSDTETRSAALTQQQNADGDEDEDTNNDAFEAVPNSEQKATQDEEDEDDEQHAASPRIYDQKFHDAEYERIREASKQQEKEINARNPKHCRVEYKDGMECAVCKNPKTGAHSQSCTFSSTAPSKKYAYTKERNYNSRDQDDDDDGKTAAATAEDDEDGDDEEEEQKVVAKPKKSPKKKSSSGHNSNKPFRPSQQRSQQLRSDDWRPILEPLHFRSSSYSAQATEQHASVVDAEPFLFGVRSSDSLSAQKHRKREAKAKKTAAAAKKAASDDDDDVYDGFSFERFFGRDFPEARSAGLVRAVDDDDEDDDGTPSAVEFLPDYESKQNVEQVLADFKKRDWSQCDRKVRDGGLTCYVCHDDRGVRHEECMFVSGADGDGAETAPKRASHLSYTETKEYHGGNEDGDDDDAKKSAALTKKPTGTAKKTAKSNRRQKQEEVSDDDDDDEDEDETTAKPVRKNVHKTRKVLAVQRRRSSRLRDADVGEHQAQAATTSSRSIKRMTADTADPVATSASSVVLSHASYEHTIRHQHDG